MTAQEVIASKGIPETVTAGLDQRALNTMAKALDSTFKAPPPEPAQLNPTVAIVAYQPEDKVSKKGVVTKGNLGQYLKIATTDSQWARGVFYRLCDGGALTQEGRNKARELLATFAERCTELAERV